MLKSMTGFAAREGSLEGWAWSWDLRSVNARGLDLRLRVPDWLPGLEVAVRKTLSEALGRGNVSLSLRISRTTEAAGAINEPALDALLDRLRTVIHRAVEHDIALVAPNALEILSSKGVSETAELTPEEAAGLVEALRADLTALLADFQTVRAGEGAAVTGVLAGQLDHVEALVAAAAVAAEARRPKQAEALKAALARALGAEPGVDPERLAQELALLAVKQDVTEEIDRLRMHVAAARTLLETAEPVGRKLDFLMQEFNREANTLCSKSGDPELTRVGLDLKATIDQMREQVQNVE